MHRTFTSGALRRAKIAVMQSITRTMQLPDEMLELEITRLNKRTVLESRTNPILDTFRDDTYPGDPDLHAAASEYLFQLARHWSSWQSPRIGTFPLEYRDYFGPVSRPQSIESGEDRAYYEIDDEIIEVITEHGGLIETAIDGWSWAPIDPTAVDPIADLVQDYIVHAVAVLERIYDITKED